ncbi:MAG: hypothetical protein NVS3B20_08840 [Polyangiales bacterium]
MMIRRIRFIGMTLTTPLSARRNYSERQQKPSGGLLPTSLSFEFLPKIRALRDTRRGTSELRSFSAKRLAPSLVVAICFHVLPAHRASGSQPVAFASTVFAELTSAKAIGQLAAPKGATLGVGVTAAGPTAPATGAEPTTPKNSNAAAANALANAASSRGSISLGNEDGKQAVPRGDLPGTHTVKKGDTLWDICDGYFHNPWQWPRVWSYNPEILNPHWIYPGELVRLKRDGGISATSEGLNGKDASGANGGEATASLRPKSVATGTVFLRNQGFVYDAKVEDTGEVVGSPEEKMLLSTFDPVYVRVTKDQGDKLFPGDTLTVFIDERAIKKGATPVGKIVQILGTVRVDTIDKNNGLVTGTIVESLDVIERGAHVGPVERKIDVVPPVTNGVDLRGVILTSIHPNVFYGANQVVLIDKGEDDALKAGNRLFIVRKGDPWRKGLASTGALTASKVSLAGDGPATVKTIDTPEDSPDYPEEVVAEIRIVRVRKNSATCLVTQSRRELEVGDTWVAKKGY